jgi:hypothetical protein
MELTLDHTFTTDTLLAWYQRASAGDSCQVHIPAMDHWVLTIIKSPEPCRVILHPEGHNPGALLFNELLVMLQNIQHELTAREHSTV